MGSITLSELLPQAETDDMVGKHQGPRRARVPARRRQGQGPPHHGRDRHRRHPPRPGPRRPAAQGAAGGLRLSAAPGPRSRDHRRLRPRWGRQGHRRGPARRRATRACGSSRSWTTRAQRPGEPDDAYTFVDRDAFEARIAADGFLEHAEFLGNLYGTPWPDAGDDRDIVLEIDVQGAEQVIGRVPADQRLFILLEPPSPEVQARAPPRPGRPARAGRGAASGWPRARSTGPGQLGRDLAIVNDDLDAHRRRGAAPHRRAARAARA